MTGPMKALVAKRAEILRKKREQDAIDKRVERAYYATCSGVHIDIMDIGKVFEVGRRAIAEGKDDGEVALAICQFVATIRKN